MFGKLILATGVLFTATGLCSSLTVNASISELLGFSYDPKLDFSAEWSGLAFNEENILKNISMSIEDSVPKIAHNILLLIYGGNYENVYTHDLNSTIEEVFSQLKTKDDKFSDVGELIYVSRGAWGLDWEEGYTPSKSDRASWFPYGITKSPAFLESYCKMADGNVCVSSTIWHSLKLPFYFSDWNTCSWKCGPPSERNFEEEGISRTDITDICFTNKPEGCQ